MYVLWQTSVHVWQAAMHSQTWQTQCHNQILNLNYLDEIIWLFQNILINQEVLQ